MTLLSMLAAYWKPARIDDRIELVWVTDDAPTRRETIALFNSMNETYRVVLDAQNGTTEKIIVQSIAGVGPDLFDCYDTSGLTAFIKADIAYDCTDDFQRLGIDLSETWPCLKPTYELNGRIYGHPANVSAPAMWYNKRMFDEAGVPYPTPDWTWDDFLAIAQRLTRRDAHGRPVQFGFLGPYDPNEYHLFWHQWNAPMYNEAGTRCMLDQPQAGAAVQFMQDIIYKHRVMPSLSDEFSMAASGGWGAGGLTLFAGEKGAMAIGGRWWLLLLRKQDYDHLRLGIVSIPKGLLPRVVGNGKTTVINKRSKRIEGALAFLAFLHSEEYNALINRQADGLGPVMKHCYTDAFLHDPDRPKEDFNAVWRDAVANADPMPVSPYVNGKEVEVRLLHQMDLIKAGKKTGEQAMRDLAARINQGIVKQLRMDPAMKAQYMDAVQHGALPAWDRPEEAP